MSTHFWNIFKVSELASTFWRNCAAFETALRTETHVLAASGLALSESFLKKQNTFALFSYFIIFARAHEYSPKWKTLSFFIKTEPKNIFAKILTYHKKCGIIYERYGWESKCSPRPKFNTQEYFSTVKNAKPRTSNAISNTFQNYNLIVNYNPKRL